MDTSGQPHIENMHTVGPRLKAVLGKASKLGLARPIQFQYIEVAR